jgi:predicted transcriptional regulator
METTIANRNASYSLVKPTRRQQVLDALHELKMATNSQLSEYLNLPINSITGRVKELRDAGEVVVMGSKYDGKTDRMVTVFAPKFKETLF